MSFQDPSLISRWVIKGEHQKVTRETAFSIEVPSTHFIIHSNQSYKIGVNLALN